MRRGLLAWLRIALRLPPAIALLLGGLLTVFIVFPLASAPARARIVSRWSRWLLRCCGIHLRETLESGTPGISGCMLVANHVSWLDIFLVQASVPASFVAKAEIRRWPLIGWLVAGAGTLFIERRRRHAIHDVNRHIERALLEGRRVAVFPEGTTGAGDRLLPFHGNLIEAALRAQAPIVPVGIRYVDHDGNMPEAVRFIGNTTFVISFFRVLGEPRVIAETYYLPPVNGATRQAVAAHARQAIAERLRLPFDDELPQVVRALRARGDPARG